jgi:hypothetical protein
MPLPSITEICTVVPFQTAVPSASPNIHNSLLEDARSPLSKHAASNLISLGACMRTRHGTKGCPSAEGEEERDPFSHGTTQN